MSLRLERWSREELVARIRELEAELAARNRELEAERAATQMYHGRIAPNAEAAGLTPRERDAVAALVGRDYVPTADLARALFGDGALIGTASEGIKNDDRHSARVYLGRASVKLERIGWRVTRRAGYGYRLEKCA